ncbi:MAG: ATP-binding protein, partial [Clostridiales bacterium]|nr:ATP-binding protein [Clostridiales bacterium]
MKNEPGKACYLPQIIEEYKGNPLIEALPSIYSSYEAAKLLTVDPGYNEGEREFDAQYRFHCIGRLFRYFQPLDT